MALKNDPFISQLEELTDHENLVGLDAFVQDREGMKEDFIHAHKFSCGPANSPLPS